MKYSAFLMLISLGSFATHAAADYAYSPIDATRANAQNIGDMVAVCNTVLDNNVDGRALQTVIGSFRTELHKNDLGKYGILSELQTLGHWCTGFGGCGQTVENDQLQTFWNMTANRVSYHIATWYNFQSKQLRVQKSRKVLTSETLVDFVLQCE